MTLKKWFQVGVVTLGSIGVLMSAPKHPQAATYNPVLKVNNHHYDVQLSHQPGKTGYALFWYGPYNTSRSTKTRDDNGSRYQNQFARVLQRKTTKTGTYAKLRINAKTIGWMNVHGLKSVSFSDVAQGTFAQSGVTGSAALISAGETTPTVVSNGLALQADQVANTSDGSISYPTASLQKLFTGAMVEQLFTEKKLAPTTRVSSFYPELKNARNITIAQLLTMTAGITGPEWTPNKPVSETAAVAHAIQTATVTNNHNFQYSDVGYVILAGIIAKVTHQSYARNFQDRILTPAGMTHSELVNQSTRVLDQPMAQSFNLDGSAVAPLSFARLTALPGAGNLVSNPVDYMAGVLALQNGQVLTQKQYRHLTSLGTHYASIYVWRPGVRFINGAFSGQQYRTGYYATPGNYHATVVFANGTTPNGTALKAITEQLYQVAKYY
ncbi:serine hydrolase [Secundilactobacillus kimchicus]|uniref:serine hydrolase n=1 Tax=Secundilactobacillus kimchicus TaxID=528209 RepID=UPI001C01721A|nr:serine hydrolase [Secundilactobacillus kimchicus]